MPRLFSKITSINYKSLLVKAAAISFLLLSYSSCSDQGCIEADDFGEYEQEILFIPSNALGENCDYDSTKTLDDADQASGLKSCFTSGTISIEDDIDEATYTSSTGCIGFTEVSIQNTCIQQCRQDCIANNSSNSNNAEPSWISTSPKESGVNSGVTITPGSKIFIRAQGTVTLVDAQSEIAFARSNEYGLQSKNSSFSPNFIDVQRANLKNVKISGEWTDSENGSNTAVGGDVQDSAQQERALNGLRRIAAYLVPHPTGYSFDQEATSESAGTQGTPLFVDTSLWSCSYNNNNSNQTQSFCQSTSYGSKYPNANITYTDTYYSITSASKSNNLGNIGGMIRWDGDDLTHHLDNVFVDNNVQCGATCSNMPNPKYGNSLGDITNGGVINNTNDYAVRVILSNFGSGDATSCNLLLTGTIKDVSNAVISDITIDVRSRNAIAGTNWSFILEPGEYVEISPNSTQFAYDSSNNRTNCGNAIIYRFHKFQDILINKSGFVSFTTLGTSSSSTPCSLIAGIINPNGSRSNVSDNYTADFYEYGSFTSNDPMFNLTVPISKRNLPESDPDFSNWSSRKVFVRKGQVIRIDPSSWGSSWNVSATVTRKCGIGMAMKIEERPALLCRGTRSDSVNNPNCIVDLNSDGEKICQSYSPACYLDEDSNPVDPNKYCPSTSCQVANPDPATCNVSSGSSPAYSVTSCQACYNAKNAAGEQDPEINANLIQCYDLENYQGKVSNIPLATGFSDDDLEDETIAKGAIKLEGFNGEYGNFSDSNITTETESSNYNNNPIYQTQQPISFNYDGRLQFLILDGNDFNSWNHYGNNGSNATSYNGTNGYKIDLSGSSTFKNGEWLEAILCEERDDDSSDCSSSSIPVQVNNQPRIVRITDPQTPGQNPEFTSYYKFDPFGSIIRFENPGAAGDNAIIREINNTSINSNYYIHDYQYNILNNENSSDSAMESAKDKVSRLRIAFKIKDPEIGNCNMSSPSLNNCTSNCNGIVTENSFYDNSVSGNINTICGATETPGNDTGNCKKQYICANKYHNNSGKYQVLVRVENKKSNISGIVDQVVSPVIEIMDGKPDGSTIGQAERIYKSIISDNRFRAIVEILMVTMITFYGVSYLMGVSEFSQSEIISRVIKIGIIYLFISPQGWYWFDSLFVNFFKNGTDYVTFLMASAFDRSTELQQAINNNQFYDKSILFSGIDQVFGMFFSSAVQKKISALLFASIFGWAYLYIIYLSFFLYIYAVANAVLLYLTAQIFISILFVLGPIFFICLLFNQTKEMFDKWLSELIGFSLQQIFLLTTLAFFNMMMYEVIKMSLGYRICWDDVWIINIYITRIKLLSWWTIASLPPRVNVQSEVGNIGNPEGIPSLFSILFIWVIASLMHKFIGFMTDIASAIGGSVKASDMGSGLKAAGNAMNKAAGQMYKKGIGKHLDSVGQSIDRSLFDSGKKAEQDRKNRREQDRKEMANRTALGRAGDAAISQYKKENAAKLANMTPEEQKEALKAARDKGIEDKAKAMGISPEEAKKLMNSKAKIRNATNATELARELFEKRKALRRKPNDNKIDTSLSGSELRAAMKNMTDEEKAELQEKIDSGNLQVKLKFGESTSNRLRNSAQNAVSNPRATASAAANTVAQAAKNAAKNPKALGKAALKKVKNAAKAPIKWGSKKAKDTIDNAKESVNEAWGAEESRARSQLEREGKIDRMATGTQWAASQTDKQQIKDRTKHNKEQTAIKSKKIDKAAQNFAARNSGGKAMSKLDIEENYQQQLQEEAAQNEQFKQDEDSKYQSEVIKMRGIKQKEPMKKAAELAAKIADKNTSKKDKQKAKEELKELKSSSEYRQDAENYKRAAANAMGHRSNIENADLKARKLDLEQKDTAKKIEALSGTKTPKTEEQPARPENDPENLNLSSIEEEPEQQPEEPEQPTERQLGAISEEENEEEEAPQTTRQTPEENE